MRRDLGRLIQQLVADSTIELVERIATVLDKSADWEAIGHLPYIPAPRLNTLLNTILQEGCQSGRSPSEIAFALRIACSVEIHHRTSTAKTELVASGPSFPPFEMRRTDEAIIQVIQGARQRLTLISFALYRIARVTSVLEDAARRGVEIRLFVELDTLRSTSIIALYGHMLAERMAVYIRSSAYQMSVEEGKLGVLHAKATIADGQVLFISSANLTEYGMSLNIELGILLRGGEEPRRVEQLFDTYQARGLFEKLVERA